MWSAPAASEVPSAEIVVTGRALPRTRAERLLDVTVIDSKQMESSPSQRLEQVLQTVPGLQLFRRSDASSAHPTSQGFTLRALGGNASSRALLVLDGVPQTDPFGGWVNWPAYPPGGLAEVRVTRGGGSLAYGPGALAGAVELTSALSNGLTAAVEGDSRASVDGLLVGGGRVGGGQLQLAVHGARGAGFIPVVRNSRGPADRAAAYRTGSARLRWVAPMMRDVELQVSGLAFDDKRERGLAFTGNRTKGQDASVRLVGRGRWQWTMLGYGQWRDLRSSFAGVDPGRTEARRVSLQDDVPGRALGWSAEVQPPLGATELRLGVDGRFTTGHSGELASYVAAAPTRRRNSGGETSTAGLFAELTRGLGPLTMSGAARVDHWTIDNGHLQERSLTTGTLSMDERYGNRSGWRPTGRAAAALEIGGGWSIRSAAYTGWRLPTLNELFRPFRAGSDATAANPQLDPERLRGAEIGARWTRGRVELSATAFLNQLRRPIANVTKGFGPGVFSGVGFVPANGVYRQRQNLRAITSKGVELSGAWRSGAWRAGLGASYVRAEVNAVGPAAELDGLRPAQTPRLTIAGDLAWERGQRGAALTLRYAGAQFDDDLNQRRLAGAFTLGAFAAWPLWRNWQLVARGENLFNARVIAGIAGDGTVERAIPRTLWLGLRFAQSRSSSGTP